MFVPIRIIRDSLYTYGDDCYISTSIYKKIKKDTLEQFKICLLFSNQYNHRYKYSPTEEVPFPDGPWEEEFIS